MVKGFFLIYLIALPHTWSLDYNTCTDGTTCLIDSGTPSYCSPETARYSGNLNSVQFYGDSTSGYIRQIGFKGVGAKPDDGGCNYNTLLGDLSLPTKVTGI